jgi:hypothetical protein
MRKVNEKAGVGIALIVILVILTCVVIGLAVKSMYADTYVITGKVAQKFLSPDGKGTTFVLKLEDGRKLELKRNLFYGGSQYNEDDLYTKIKEGSSYRFTCWGWQVDFWFVYWYPNVIKAEQI